MIQAGTKIIRGQDSWTVPAGVNYVQVTLNVDINIFPTRPKIIKVKPGHTYNLYAYYLTYDKTLMAAGIESETREWNFAKGTPQGISPTWPRIDAQATLEWSQEIEDDSIDYEDVDDSLVGENPQRPESYLEIFNDDNHLLIDDYYRNLIYLRKERVYATWHTLTVSTPGGGSIDVSALQAVVNMPADAVTALARPVNPPAGGIGFALWVHSKASRLLTIGVDSRNGTGQNTSIPFDIYYFGDQEPTSTSNLGLEVFDASGRLVYSSANRYLRVVGSKYGGITLTPWPLMGADGSGTTGNTLMSLCAHNGRTLAVGPCITPWCYWDWNPQGHRISILGYKYQSNGIDIAAFPYHMGGIRDITGPADAMKRELTMPSTYLVADVTGY